MSTATPSTIELITDGTLTYRVSGETRTIFRGLNLTMKQGTCLVIIGPNACGKTSLLRAILGFVSIDAGRIGVQLADRDLLGAVLQDYRSQLLPWGTVADNLSLPVGGGRDCGATEADIHAAFCDFLCRLGYDIPLSKNTRHLSGGQQQAVVLARALAFRPSFVCWDEPTSAIDFPKRGLLYDLVQREWKERRSSVIAVTHDADEALLLADRVIVFDAQMHILLDQEVGSLDRPRDRGFLESEDARRQHASIRSAMIGNGTATGTRFRATSEQP